MFSFLAVYRVISLLFFSDEIKVSEKLDDVEVSQTTVISSGKDANLTLYSMPFDEQERFKASHTFHLHSVPGESA